MFANKTVYLASSSPRRYRILADLGLQVIVSPSHIDESRKHNETPTDFVLRLAKEKNNFDIQKHQHLPVVSADTIVVLDDKILGKPADDGQAYDMLCSLSGRTHQVMTAVCVAGKNFCQTALSVSEVTFADLMLDEIVDYIFTKEPYDKAGGYGIQGLGGCFVSHLSGSYTGVMGLPVFETVDLLNQFWYQMYEDECF